MRDIADIRIILLTDQLGYKENGLGWMGYLGHHSFLQMQSGKDLSSCIAAQYKSFTGPKRNALKQVVKIRTREAVTAKSATSIYISRAASILKNPSHLAHGLPNPLPSGRRLHSIKAKTTRVHRVTV